MLTFVDLSSIFVKAKYRKSSLLDAATIAGDRSMFIVAATISEVSDISAATIPEFSIIKGVMNKKILEIEWPYG